MVDTLQMILFYFSMQKCNCKCKRVNYKCQDLSKESISTILMEDLNMMSRKPPCKQDAILIGHVLKRIEHNWLKHSPIFHNDTYSTATRKAKCFSYLEQNKVNKHSITCPQAGIILCMHPAKEGWHYIVTSSPIGWVHTQNDPRLGKLQDIYVYIFRADGNKILKIHNLELTATKQWECTISTGISITNGKTLQARIPRELSSHTTDPWPVTL